MEQTDKNELEMIKTKKKVVPLPKLLKKTQEIVNKAVRERDKELGCISRGCKGSVEHAGHYFNQGNHSGLRYDMDNIHGSCIKCNLYLSGNLIKYRQGLVDRYGESFVTKLEAKAEKNPVIKWHRIELEQIIQTLKQK